MLGICLAPNDNWETELQYLLSVTSDWKVHMVGAKLTPADATFSLKNVVLQKLNYPLVTTMFSNQQCTQIMSPILHQESLPKAGVIHTFSRALVHSPLDYRGLTFPVSIQNKLLPTSTLSSDMVQIKMTQLACITRDQGGNGKSDMETSC